MIGSQRKIIAILAQIIANRNLSAERIPAICHIEFIQIVRESLYQNRLPQAGQFDGVNNSLFIAEIGQTDQNSVDFIHMLFK